MNGLIPYAKLGSIPTPYKIKESVATVADLPASGNTAGDVRRVTATDTDYYWDGNSWETFVAGEKFTNADRIKLDGISAGATAVSVSNEGTATDAIQYITVNGTEKKIVGAGSDENAVHFTADAGKTDAEKLQARTNIGAYAKPSGGIPSSDLASAVANAINGSEQKSRMVTVVDHTSDNDHYPTAKAVYNAINAMLINAHPNIASYGSVTGTNIYKKGESCTLVATPNTGYSFVKWKVAGSTQTLSEDATYTFNVEDSLEIIGVFKDENLQIVSWADGTDAQIAAMVEAADNGIISLSDYWAVGNTRTVNLSAMESDSTKGYEAHEAQTVELTLMEYADCTGITVNGQKPSFIVGQKNGLLETGQMNTQSTNAGGWGACKRRGWCNDVYKMAIPSTLRGIFKQFTWQYVTSGTDGTLLTANDYFALPPERAIFESRTHSRTEEWDLFNQWAWYQTPGNRIKKTGASGSAYYWWECSPLTGYSNYFCCVYDIGGADYWNANNSILLAPFGCI